MTAVLQFTDVLDNKDVFNSVLGLTVIILIFVGLPTKPVVSLARRAHKKFLKRRRLMADDSLHRAGRLSVAV